VLDRKVDPQLISSKPRLPGCSNVSVAEAAMTELYIGLALILLLTIAIGLVRVLRGPTATDRMLAAQLFGTTAVAILLLLGQAGDNTAIWDVALIFALLTAVAAVTFVRRKDIDTATETEETMSMTDLITALLLLCSLPFFLAGTLGLLRFPDLYCRLHA
jgi:multicomponent Na+:H+ antiporter subunit F